MMKNIDIIIKAWNSCRLSCDEAAKAFKNLGKIGFELKQSGNKKKIYMNHNLIKRFNK